MTQDSGAAKDRIFCRHLSAGQAPAKQRPTGTSSVLAFMAPACGLALVTFSSHLARHAVGLIDLDPTTSAHVWSVPVTRLRASALRRSALRPDRDEPLPVERQGRPSRTFFHFHLPRRPALRGRRGGPLDRRREVECDRTLLDSRAQARSARPGTSGTGNGRGLTSGTYRGRRPAGLCAPGPQGSERQTVMSIQGTRPRRKRAAVEGWSRGRSGGPAHGCARWSLRDWRGIRRGAHPRSATGRIRPLIGGAHLRPVGNGGVPVVQAVTGTPCPRRRLTRRALSIGRRSVHPAREVFRRGRGFQHGSSGRGLRRRVG